jgi:TolA-binding protein
MTKGLFMSIKTLFLVMLIYLLVSSLPVAFAQSSSDAALQQAIKDFIDQNFVNYGEDFIAQERFLVEQMRLINYEISARVSNIDQARDKYFSGLKSRLKEIKDLKARLQGSGSASLTAFIDKLQTSIEQTIDEGKLNYERQKVLEDGLQLLYIAEEMYNLDSGTKVESNPQIAQRLEASRQLLMNNFGDTKKAAADLNYTSISSASPNNIFGLFKTWKQDNMLKYETRWADVQAIKNSMLRESTVQEKERIFNRELESALMAYNFARFDLAERMFGEILTRYDFLKQVDDIYFYEGEANYYLDRFSNAQDAYLQLVDKFPASSFAAAAYSRLVYIAYHFEQPDKVAEYYSKYEQVATANSPNHDETSFVAAHSAFKSVDYATTVNLLNSIPPASDFYVDARYLMAQAYIGANNFKEAENVLTELIKDYTLTTDYYFNLLLKLGYIKYEQGEYPVSIHYLDQIGGNFPWYDRVLLCYGWNYYKLELQKTKDQPKDYSYAKYYLQLLLDSFLTSDYYLEAKSLLGYIYQLEEQTNSAIDQFDAVFRSRFIKEQADQTMVKRDSLEKKLLNLEADKYSALTENNVQSFSTTQSQYSGVQDSLLIVGYEDETLAWQATESEVDKIKEQVKELDRLKKIAAERKSTALVARIENLQDRLKNSLKNSSSTTGDEQKDVGYLASNSAARRESVIEDQNKKIEEVREEIQSQRQLLDNSLLDISAEIDRAREAKNFKRMVHMEVKRDQYESLKARYDALATYIYDLDPAASNINLQKWSDYSAFGIANVNYAVKQNKLNQRAFYMDQINKINQILNSRKTTLDFMINQIDGEISFMTRRVRRQERLRERAELNRKFEETYFDTHTSESEEAQPKPPEVEKK